MYLYDSYSHSARFFLLPNFKFHVSDLMSRLDSGRVTPIKAEQNAREWLAKVKVVCACRVEDLERPSRRFLDRGRIGYLARRQAKL